MLEDTNSLDAARLTVLFCTYNDAEVLRFINSITSQKNISVTLTKSPNSECKSMTGAWVTGIEDLK